MQNRMQVLQNLIELRLRADANDKLDAVYQFMLRDARPTESDIDYIDQQVNRRNLYVAITRGPVLKAR